MASLVQLLEELEKDFDDHRLTPLEQTALLEQVKIFSRDAARAAPLFTKNSVRLLASYGLNSTSTSTSHEALKCLANVLLLHEPSRRTVVELDFVPKLVARLGLPSDEDEFLAAKILFLLTYNAKLDAPTHVEQHDLPDKVLGQLSRHADHSRQQPSGVPLSLITSDMALSETLKLLFNITHFYPDTPTAFSTAAPILSDLLLRHTLPSPPLQPPITLLINAMFNLELPPSDTRSALVERLVHILDASLGNQAESDLDAVAAPLITLLRRLGDDGPSTIRDQLREALLPSAIDRDKPLGQGSSLHSRVLRLCTSARSPLLRENVSGLLFELSDKDPTKFVRNVGYGYAAGFLMNHNLPVPPSVSSHDDAGGVVGGEPINPVTGQRLSAEERDAPADAPEMTDEEKEREAERLFVLFERLRATGVVDVKNPIQDAIDEGRFQELPD